MTFSRLSFFFNLIIILQACGGGGGTDNSLPSLPVSTSFTWQVATPDSQGLDSAKVEAAMNLAMEDGNFSQAAIIIKDGKIVAEQYKGIGTAEKTLILDSGSAWTSDTVDLAFGSKDVNSLVTSWSVAKSYTSIIFGIAQELSLIHI